jgi:hypothetical protein
MIRRSAWRSRRSRSLVCAIALSLGPTAAAAQTFAVPFGAARHAMARDERTRAWTLLTEGAASIAVGVPLLAATDDPGVRWAGVMTATFGAVNVGLAVPWLLGVSAEERAVPGEADLTARLRRSRSARRTAAVFALNVGLDALYLVAGAAAYALGAANADDGLRGGGVASMAQGAFLLGFDLWGWIASDANADRFVR